MKRFTLIALGALLAGCGENSPPAQTTSETASAVNPAAPAPETVKPAPPAPEKPAAESTPPAPTPAPTTPPPVNPASIPDVAPAVIAAPAPAPAKDVPIFETVKDGKTYVFSSAEAMNEFGGSGKQPPVVMEKANFIDSGATIVIEADSDAQAAQMLASYAKLHPAAAK